MFNFRLLQSFKARHIFFGCTNHDKGVGLCSELCMRLSYNKNGVFSGNRTHASLIFRIERQLHRLSPSCFRRNSQYVVYYLINCFFYFLTITHYNLFKIFFIGCLIVTNSRHLLLSAFEVLVLTIQTY